MDCLEGCLFSGENRPKKSIDKISIPTIFHRYFSFKGGKNLHIVKRVILGDAGWFFLSKDEKLF